MPNHPLRESYLKTWASKASCGRGFADPQSLRLIFPIKPVFQWARPRPGLAKTVRIAVDMEGSSGVTPVLKDVVLLGGGHTHVEVLRSFGMQPMPGVRLTLISKDVHTAYSGMLPGFVARYYTFDDCHVDLSRMASFAKAIFINAAATSIDIDRQEILLEGRPPINYDVLSVDVGITPSGQGIPGALTHAVPVKPVSSFVERLAKIRKRNEAADQPLKIAVVGGGAGGVELTMSMHHYLQESHRDSGSAAAPVEVRIFSRKKILASHPAGARKVFLRIMKEKGIRVSENTAVKEVQAGKLILGDGQIAQFDECLWCTQAGAPSWLRSTKIPLNEAGFIAIGETLQSTGPSNVFAVGDVASSTVHPRPKAGVFAVRQGPPLTANLRRYLKGEPLQPFKPQTSFLSLITTGDQYCVATKGWFCLEGTYLWHWKDKIDRGWMDKYGKDLPSMEPATADSEVARAAGPEAQAVLAASHMRCGGCGAKVGASVLSSALRRLPKGHTSDVVLAGLDARDDAAVVRPPPAGHVLVQTVDFLPSFVNDPYIFGAIAANHALGDCHAMGAQPLTALALAVVPQGLDAKVEETLYQCMAGAVQSLNAAGCSLVGGHTCEGTELSLGFAINGVAKEEEILRKGGARQGQALILTKALGTGVIMAASMRGRAKGRWVAGALESMQQSSKQAAECLKRAGATSCTDVTGFGLLGHLQEMAAASHVRMRLDALALPVLAGALHCAQAGIASSLLPQNARVEAWVAAADQAAMLPQWPLVLDPQTGGGLLASVPAKAADACVEELKALGYTNSAIVGGVLAEVENDGSSEPKQLITVLSV